MTNSRNWRIFSVITVLLLMTVVAATAIQTRPVLAAAGIWDLQTVDTREVRGTSIAIDVNGYPHISYYDGTDPVNCKLKYARWTGSAWAIEIVDSPLGACYNAGTSIVLDSGNLPHIAYSDYAGATVKYAGWTGSAWDIKSLGANGHNPSLALDSHGIPRISFTGAAGNLEYARWSPSPGIWLIETVDSSGGYTSLALDSNDVPRIGYSMGGGSAVYIKYATRAYGGTWSTGIVDTYYAGAGYSSLSLKLDSGNQPHLAYSDPEHKTLKYVWLVDDVWQRETVDTAPVRYNSTSLALDSSNRPHISYTDVGALSLHYAVRTESAWVKETVDPGEFLDSSIALDNGGNPQISYASSGATSLHYARFFPTPTITAVSPATGLCGQDLTVTLTGSDFVGVMSVSFGAGILVNSFIIDSPTQIRASISIMQSSAPGYRDVSVTTPGGTATKPGGFSVVQQNQSIGAGSHSSSPVSPIASAPPVSLPSIFVQNASLSSKTVTSGTPVTVTADIINRSTVNGNKKVTLYVNGQVETTQGAVVNSGASSTLTFNVSRSEPGDYSVYVDGVPAGSFTVEMVTGNDSMLIFGIVMLAMAFAAGMVMLWRRQRAD